MKSSLREFYPFINQRGDGVVGPSKKAFCNSHLILCYSDRNFGLFNNCLLDTQCIGLQPPSNLTHTQCEPLILYLLTIRAVTKISSCWVNTTTRRGIKQLRISFGSIFFYFPMKVAGTTFLVTGGNPQSPSLNDSPAYAVSSNINNPSTRF